jgi:hypothetical protein
MAAISSAANGNWSTGATWTGGVAPGDGDTATVAHAVTITADTVIGTGANETVLAVATSATGASLTITGAKLTIKGNATFGGAYMAGTIGTRLTLQPNGTTPGGIEFDGNSGVSPVVSIHVDVLLRFLGTTAGHCYVRTKSGTAGGNGRFVNSDSNRSFFVEATYTDFSYLGDATYAGMKPAKATWAVSPANPLFTLDHCTFDYCGAIPDIVLDETSKESVIFRMQDCVWTNGVGTNSFVISVQSSHALTASGQRLINRCVVMGPSARIWDATGFTITNNYFDKLISTNRDYLWTSFDGNLSRNTSTNNNDRPGMLGDATNNFYLLDPSDPASYGMGVLTSYWSSSITDNVFEYTGTSTSPTVAIYISEDNDRNKHTLIERNLCLPAPNATFGASGITLADLLDPAANDPYGATQSVNHNTVCVGAFSGNAAMRTGGQPGEITSFKSNLFWRDGTVDGQYAIKDQNSSGTHANDLIAIPEGVSQADYNGWWNLALTPPTQFSAPNDKGNSTVYYLPLSVAPGTHDVEDVDPAFIAPTRSLAAWDAYKGGEGTIAGSLARLQADPTLTKTDLIPWVRAGFAPTAAAYNGTAHDGNTIGAVGFQSPASGGNRFATPVRRFGPGIQFGTLTI